jgi:hypothetical protein
MMKFRVEEGWDNGGGRLGAWPRHGGEFGARPVRAM